MLPFFLRHFLPRESAISFLPSSLFVSQLFRFLLFSFVEQLFFSLFLYSPSFIGDNLCLFSLSLTFLLGTLSCFLICGSTASSSPHLSVSCYFPFILSISCSSTFFLSLRVIGFSLFLLVPFTVSSLWLSLFLNFFLLRRSAIFPLLLRRAITYLPLSFSVSAVFHPLFPPL